MTADEQLVVLLEARVAEFEKRMRRAEQTGTRSYQGLQRRSGAATKAMEADMLRSTSRINQALATTSSRIGTFGKAFVGGLVAGGAAAAFTGIARGVRETTRQIATMADEAKRAGLSLDAFQELKFVAEQNRVGVDQMIDGLKELSLRADEFIVTGKGPAAEAFGRLGLDATTLARKLKEPDQLFLDIIGRMESLDRAAQIRIADEVFGGTGGEMFVQLIGQGEAALRRTIETGREAGAVLDEELIRKAEELDRRFQALQTRVSAFGKELAVGLADAAVKIATLRTDLDDLFANPEQARALLGEGIAGTLEADDATLERHQAEVEALRSEYARLNDEAAALTGPLYQAAAMLASLGETGAAAELSAVATEMGDVTLAMDQGRIEADAFEAEVDALARRASNALAEVSAIDGAGFANVTSALGGFIARLGDAIVRARELRASLPGDTSGAGTTTVPVYGEVGARGDPRQFGTFKERSRLAPKTSARPTRPGVDSYPALAPIGGGGGGGGRGGGGGGGGRADPYREAVEGMRLDVRRLEAEAAALVVLAKTGRDVGDALDYARKRADLLEAAQEAGKSITPELSAEIDKLAESYARAGVAAQDAADDMQEVRDRAEAGAERMAGLFGSILDGSMKAKDAVKGLLLEVAKSQLLAGFQGLASMSGGRGIFGAIGTLFGGFRAAGGPVDPSKAYIVGERGPELFSPASAGRIIPNDAIATRRLGESTVRVQLALPDGVTIEDVRQIAGQVSVEAVRSSNAARDRAMPGKVNAVRANTHPRAR